LKPGNFVSLHAELLHDAGSVGFNRALGRAQIKGDLLVQLTADNVSQHLAFARGEVFIAAVDRRNIDADVEMMMSVE
jgi:hypothetical protein